MASIQTYLTNILKAVYGKDVRQNIHDAIKQCYYDGKAGATDLEARERISIIEASKPESANTVQSEVAGIRVGADGETYQTAGDAVRGQLCNISSHSILGGLNTIIKFDTVNNTVTIPKYTMIVQGTKQIYRTNEDCIITHKFNEEEESNVLYFDKANNTFGVTGITSSVEKSNQNILLATWWKRLNENKKTLRCIGPFTIDGVKYDNYNDEFDPQSIPLSKLTTHGNVALVCNAFGNSINFDFENKNITIPRYCVIGCGGERIYYNNEAPKVLNIPSTVSGERSLLFDLDSQEFVITSYMSGLKMYPNSLLVAIWWNETDTGEKSIICTSRYTINGEKVNQYNEPLTGDTNITVDGAKTLADKKVLIIGDSISTDGYGSYEKWATKLIKKGFFGSDNVTNNSIHATGFVATYSGNDDFITRIKNVGNKDTYDLVIIFGGINDYIQNISMTNFKTAVDTFFTYLVNNFVNARICVLSPLRTHTTWTNTQGEYETAYSDYIKTAAKSYCLPTLNLTDESGFCPFITAFKDKWTLMPSGYTSTDGVHPTEEYGEKYLAPMIENFLSGLL